MAQVLSFVLPAGSFERVENAAGRLQVVPGSFQLTPDAPALSPLASLTAIPKGFSEAHEIIFFALIIGGAFAVFRATGAVDSAMGALLRRWGDRPFWLVAGGISLFAVGSATIGFGEEYFPFVPVLITLSLTLGYDRITAVGIVMVGYGVGYGAAAHQPLHRSSRPGRGGTPTRIGAVVSHGAHGGFPTDWHSPRLVLCEEGGAGSGGEPGGRRERARRGVDLEGRRRGVPCRALSDDHHA